MGAEASASELAKLRESAIAAEQEMKAGKTKLQAAAAALKRLVSAPDHLPPLQSNQINHHP